MFYGPVILQYMWNTYLRTKFGPIGTLLILCHIGFCDVAKSEVSTKTIIVLDGSRSMWGKIGGQRKYKLSVSALKDLIDSSQISKFAILTFGSKRKRSCNDIQFLKPFNEPWSDIHLKKLNSFRPRGRAALSNSLQKISKDVDLKNHSIRIVLLVDGFDNCKLDPCRIAEGMQETAYDLSLHIVGVGVSKRDQRRFQCFGKIKNTSINFVKKIQDLKPQLGFTFNLPNPRALQLAYEKRQARQAQREKDIESLLAGKPRIKLHAVFSEGSLPIREGLSWKVYRAPRNSQSQGTLVAQSSSAQPSIELKPGQYIAEVRYRSFGQKKLVQVPEKGSLTHILDLNAGTLKLSTLNQATGENVDDVFYTIYPIKNQGTPERRPFARSNESQPVFYLPAGKYYITATLGNMKLERRIDIVPGKTKQVDLNLGLGTLSLKTIASEGLKPLSRIFYTIYKDTNIRSDQEISTNKAIIRTAAPQPKLQLQQGNYIVHAEHDLAKTSQRIKIRAGKTLDIIMNLRAGLLSLKSKIEGADKLLNHSVSYQLFPFEISENEPGEEIARTSQAQKEYLLSPGKYKVIARYGSVNAITEGIITLKPGKTGTLTLNHTAGEVSLALIDQKNGFAKINVFWQIFDQKGNQIWQTSQPKPNIVLKSGSYKAVAEHRSVLYEKEISVQTGEKTDVKIITK